jgi:hypothetical protein
MAKDSKLQNLLKFTEYQNLQPKQKSTKRTEVGGFAVLEHHLEGDSAGQIKFIEENIKKCGKKRLQKIYHMVENCVIKKEKKEKKKTEEKSSETGPKA